MPSTLLRNKLMKNVRSVVVKLGTAVLTKKDGRLDKPLIGRVCRQIAALHERGIRVTLVSSGAVGAGMGLTQQKQRPRTLPGLQAAAAIGQPNLMGIYARAFNRYDIQVGQVLVTRQDFEQRSRYVNISNTLNALQKLSAIPIINENDTIAVDELDKFADNDTIAALVTNLIRADLLVLLTVVDGLLTADGQLVDLVPQVDGEIYKLVNKSRSSLGSGGMAGKLGAAKMVAGAGEGVVIANGRRKDVLTRLLDGERVGTIFAPSPKKLSARQRWIAGAVRPSGKVHIDAGAVGAVIEGGKSLLSKGITRVEGKFGRGAIVRILAPSGQTIAHGVTNYDRQELDLIKGLKSNEFTAILGEKPFDEAIHRDNLVLTPGED